MANLLSATAISLRERNAFIDDVQAAIAAASRSRVPSDATSSDGLAASADEDASDVVDLTFSSDDDDDGDDDMLVDEDDEHLRPPPRRRARRADDVSGAALGPAPPPALPPLLAEPSDSASSDDAPHAPPGPGAVVARVSAANCPLCYEQMPYIADAATRAVVSARVGDARRTIFEFIEQNTGQLDDEVLFKSAVSLRQLLVEQHLERFSSTRFRRWTPELVRAHYDPVHGHRPSYVRKLETESRKLEQLRDDMDRYALFPLDPETNERQFNPRAIDQRLRLSSVLTSVLKAKEAALTMRAQARETDAASLVDAISHATIVTSGASRAYLRVPRLASDSTSTAVGRIDANDYNLGGL